MAWLPGASATVEPARYASAWRRGRAPTAARSVGQSAQDRHPPFCRSPRRRSRAMGTVVSKSISLAQSGVTVMATMRSYRLRTWASKPSHCSGGRVRDGMPPGSRPAPHRRRRARLAHARTALGAAHRSCRSRSRPAGPPEALSAWARRGSSRTGTSPVPQIARRDDARPTVQAGVGEVQYRYLTEQLPCDRLGHHIGNARHADLTILRGDLVTRLPPDHAHRSAPVRRARGDAVAQGDATLLEGRWRHRRGNLASCRRRPCQKLATARYRNSAPAGVDRGRGH